MKFLNNIVDARLIPGRVLLLLVGMLVLSACSTKQVIETSPPPTLNNHGAVYQVNDVDVLELTPEMDAFLERYVLNYSDPQTRLYLLMDAISSNGVLGFRYNEALTLTAEQAFNQHTGNCIAFANMLIGLARGAGLKAHYQEVIRRPVWVSQEDTVLVIKHINVVVEVPGNVFVVDVSGVENSHNHRQRIIDDSYAKALYWNNFGAEALLENDLRTAYGYFAKAIETEPTTTDVWVNMGVLMGRNEQLDDAAFALEQALKIDATEYSAMSNLYEVYLAQEDMVAAAVLQEKVEKYRSSNPYYLLKLSDEALAEANFEESISLLRRAIRKKKDDHQLHFALAKTQYLSGDIKHAEGSLLKARELAPQDMLDFYGQSLERLVASQ